MRLVLFIKQKALFISSCTPMHRVVMLREAYICDPRVKNDDEATLDLLRLIDQNDIVEGLEADEKALL